MTLLLLLALGGCDRPRERIGASAPSGGFIDDRRTPATIIDNPLEGQPAAVEAGKQLFTQMNCVGCHGYDLKGGTMAPDLTDRYWRYGGAPSQIYLSIANGRPEGMPAWRDALPASEIWKLVSYIEAQGGAAAPAGNGPGASSTAARTAFP